MLYRVIYDAQTIWIRVQNTLATLWDPIFKSLLLPDLPYILHLTKVLPLGYCTRKPGCFFLSALSQISVSGFVSRVKWQEGRERISNRLAPTLSLGHSSSNNKEEFFVLRVLGAFLPIAVPLQQGCSTRNGACDILLPLAQTRKRWLLLNFYLYLLQFQEKAIFEPKSGPTEVKKEEKLVTQCQIVHSSSCDFFPSSILLPFIFQTPHIAASFNLRDFSCFQYRGEPEWNMFTLSSRELTLCYFLRHWKSFVIS